MKGKYVGGEQIGTRLNVGKIKSITERVRDREGGYSVHSEQG